MSETPRVGFALLGAGLVAPFHAKSIVAADDCELIAIADLDSKRAGKMADEYGCKACTSLDELLADDAVEVVNILTPNHLHHDAVLAVAAAGKHVLCEKPPAMSLTETDAMIKACDDAGVKFGIVLQCRIRKAIQAIRGAVMDGRFGKILQADIYMKWFRSTDYYLSDEWRKSRRSGAGVTIQHAFHYIDLLQYIVGPVASVDARMTNLAHPQVELEDSLRAFIEYRNGAQGVVVASTALWPGCDIRIEINGQDGLAVMAGERMEAWQFRDDRDEDEEIRAIGRDAVSTGATGPADFDFADHQTVIQAMAKAARQGAEPAITAASARDTLEIALAMYQSAAKGKPVALPVSDQDTVWL